MRSLSVTAAGRMLQGPLRSTTNLPACGDERGCPLSKCQNHAGFILQKDWYVDVTAVSSQKTSFCMLLGMSEKSE